MKQNDSFVPMITEALQTYLNWGERDSPVDIPQESLAKIQLSYESLQRILEHGKVEIYGIHTRFGRNVDQKVEMNQIISQQRELLSYLSVGVGRPISPRIVRRALKIQCMKIALGFSGVHPSTFSKLLEFANHGELEAVPRFGSLGASGDLIPMAHAIKPIFAQYEPIGPRDVLALVNTNSMMVSFAIEVFDEIVKSFQLAIIAITQISLALGIDTKLFDSRFQNPQGIDDHMSYLCDSIQLIIKKFHPFRPVDFSGEFPLQERYSVRCAPQILASILGDIKRTQDLLDLEVKRIADNPILILQEPQEFPKIWHGGHFFAIGVARSADFLNDACQRLIELLDRQILLLMTPDTSHHLPVNLEVEGCGHLKGLHQLASSLRQHARTHSTPSNMLSFSCESHNQDVVPCGMAALDQLEALSKILVEMTKVGLFCADRAFHLRYRLNLPEDLHLNRWPNYSSNLTLSRFCLT